MSISHMALIYDFSLQYYNTHLKRRFSTLFKKFKTDIDKVLRAMLIALNIMPLPTLSDVYSILTTDTTLIALAYQTSPLTMDDFIL